MMPSRKMFSLFGRRGSSAAPAKAAAGTSLCVTVDDHPYRSKAQAKREIAAITRRMQASSHAELALDEFVHLLGRGHAWCGGCFRGRPDAWGDFVCMRLFGLDFDGARCGTGRAGTFGPETALARCEAYGVEPAAYYHTFSSTPEHPRFRLVVDVGTPFVESEQARAYARLLLRLFPEADKACSNLNRIFFGGNGRAVALSVSAGSGTRALEGLRSRLETDATRRSPSVRAMKKAGTSRGRRVARKDEDLEACKAKAPLLELIRRQTGMQGEEHGNRIDFTPCPVCGHNRCFSYYADSNSWVCFSSSNKTGYHGGSYIDFLLACGLAENVADAIELMREVTDEA